MTPYLRCRPLGRERRQGHRQPGSLDGLGGRRGGKEPATGGAPRRVLDVDRLHALRWKHTIELNTGIETSSAGSSSASTARGW